MEDPGVVPASMGTRGPFREAQVRREKFLSLIESGYTIEDACRETGITVHTYRRWRERFPYFKSHIDMARARRDDNRGIWNGSHASFTKYYFGMEYGWHHLLWIDELENMPPGNILMVLFPPEHGKTTMFENYASEMLARFPDHRIGVASEGISISQKILGRVKHRMEPEGPFPRFVADFGPFKPQTKLKSEERQAQPWGATYFNVFKKSRHDERDYSMVALGWTGSIVSARFDHLHMDDLQSLKTLNQTDRIEAWVRQDALSRTGEYGKNTIAGTRVGEDDVYERLADDPELEGILKVIRLPAILTDNITGEQKPLWPERYSLEQLERVKRKAGQEAWDRNYMQNPGASSTHLATFTDAVIEPALDANRSLLDPPTDGSIVYVGLDPALGSMNCIVACEITTDGKMIVRAIREDVGFQRNEQIMGALEEVVRNMQVHARVPDVVIEAKNFQAGLARDERLMDMQRRLGFVAREHLTGINKYDERIGVASMAESFMRGDIILPWAADDRTRHEVGELVKQLKAWKPFKRGNKLRQDRVMALWFVWVLWRNRWKRPPEINPGGFRRQGLPSYIKASSGLIIPAGVRL